MVDIQDYMIIMDDISNTQKALIIQILKKRSEKIYKYTTIYSTNPPPIKGTRFWFDGGNWCGTTKAVKHDKIELTPDDFIKKFNKPRFNYCLKSCFD